MFKGGTCLRYLFGFDRFSEDLDFNLLTSPNEFREQVRRTTKEIALVGTETHFLKEELFEDAFTCEIAFHGPLYEETGHTQNKIRIDAGRRAGTLKEPEWRLISSEYPETREHFLTLVMSEGEMLVEKVVDLMERRKGRDLYDVWFLLVKGVVSDKELFAKKSRSEFRFDLIVSEEEYERDLKRLTSRIIPYSQVRRDLEEGLSPLRP